MKKILIIILFISFIFSADTRIKELVYINNARPLHLMGYGLVVGLKNSGDSPQILLTNKSMYNLLKRMGLSPEESDVRSRNTASVMVTAELPPFFKKGQKIDVQVSSMGDATSLRGGTLLLTPLVSSDGLTYLTAQGNIIVSGISVEQEASRFQRNEANKGMITNGGIVERELNVDLSEHDYLELILKEADFITATRIGKVIEDSGLASCEKYDSSKVMVRLGEKHKQDMVEFIANLLDLKVQPDTTAKIVISERTGTIVIGEKVRISPVAITFGDVNIKIDRDITDVININVTEAKSQFKIVEQGDTLQDLVRSLNALGTKPSTMISILQAIKAAGAISAEIEII